MDAVNQTRFNAQMAFLKTANFGQYLYKWRWFCMTIPLISLVFNFDTNSIVFNVLRMAIIEIVALWTIYSMYLFFKPLASTHTVAFSKMKLFLMYFVNMTVMWFLLNSHLNTSHFSMRNFLIELGISIAFGLIFSGIMASCMNENIKVFVRNKGHQI
ncbi:MULTISPECIES: hypothetical protein [Leuconostoc]|uniref:Uncharacterized protein n=2 Tax=Leuconostoc kimchii TaxID=136609 RepID=D5T380_LEUKI|nr:MULTISPECIES: hypothetical protein [Leuconostoc]ADG40729.1 hypothetical protein LKI_05945 [Leuconostoc kimchii IMSNU 11154]AEJ31296.1 hypothetical protein LGMK_06195 [Leuconostoc sp. C2]QBR48377.1 hypothetical protein EW139_09720 [Leuconostoc kimchii]